ncbi:MAG: alkaline phosphatase [Negativicutes bacterium]
MKKRLGIYFMVIAVFVGGLLGSTSVSAAEPVKNVIVLMMDGTGSTHTTLARWYKGAPLALDEMVTGGVRTYCADSIITDSAPAATAFATGHKSNTKFIGVLPVQTTIPGLEKIERELQFQPVATVLEGAKLAGKSTGLIATSNIQHASPAAFSAHWASRSDYKEIAEQQVYENINVVLSAGSPYLLPKELGGKRQDGENLVAVLENKGYAYIEDRDALMNIKSGKVWGMFGTDDMAYEMDRRVLAPQQPSLAEMTQKAIDLLSQNQKGFFLFIEGSKVDWASHANDPIGVISDVLAFDDAVQAALKYAKKDGHTLVLAFSDHGNGGMSIGSKTTDKNYDTLPLETVIDPLKRAQVTGEGLAKLLAGNREPDIIRDLMTRYYGIDNLTEEEVSLIQKAKDGDIISVVGPMMSKRAAIGWTTSGHTGEDLFMYAYGPNRPVGMIENTDIARITAKGLGFDLDKVNDKLFVDASKAFGEIGAKISIDRSDPQNLVLIAEKGRIKAEMPFSKNILKIGEKTYELNGITVFAPKTGKVYIPQQAVNLFQEAGQ